MPPPLIPQPLPPNHAPQSPQLSRLLAQSQRLPGICPLTTPLLLLVLVPLPGTLASLPFSCSASSSSLPGPRASPPGLKPHRPFSSVQLLSHVRLFETPWIAARQASLSITNSWSSLKLMTISSVMPSSHLILWRPLLLLPPIPPSIRVFSNESTLRMRWPKDFSFSITWGRYQGQVWGTLVSWTQTPTPVSQSLFPHLASLHPRLQTCPGQCRCELTLGPRGCPHVVDHECAVGE